MEKIINKYKNMPVQASASLWFLFCSFMQKGISALTTPIFTRIMTTSEYGQYNVFISWYSLIMVIVSLNLYGGVYMQGLVKFESERKQFSSSLQGLTLSLTIVWTAIYLLSHNFWNEIFSLSTTQMLCMFVLIWTTSAFTFWASEQRVNFRCRNLVVITIIVSLAKPVIGILFVAMSNDKVTARIIGIMLVELLLYSGCFFSQIYKGKQFFSAKYWKYAIKFNLPLIPHYLSIVVLSSVDRIMISQISGVAASGIYSLAYSVSLIMTMFNNALFQTIEPWIYKKINTKEIEGIAKVAYASFVLIAVVNLGLIGFAPEVITFFAPVEYADAIWVIPPIAMSVYFMFAYTFFATFEFYFEKTRHIAIATTLGAVLNIILNYIFIPIFGYYVAGYTTLICYILFALVHYYFMRKVCRNYLDNRQPYNTKILMLISAGFMTIGFMILFTYNNRFIRYSLILITVISIVIKRKYIFQVLKELINLKKKTS